MFLKGGGGRTRGQSSVEAAILLPTLGLIVALLAQPACLAYTRALMYVAAGEAARVLATAPEEGRDELVLDYVRRRLKAVPEVSAFHEGGQEDWELTAELSEDGRWAKVNIKGHVRPLPLVGIAVQALYPHDEEGSLLEVNVTEQVRPLWLEGSFNEWISAWG